MEEHYMKRKFTKIPVLASKMTVSTQDFRVYNVAFDTLEEYNKSNRGVEDLCANVYLVADSAAHGKFAQLQDGEQYNIDYKSIKEMLEEGYDLYYQAIADTGKNYDFTTVYLEIYGVGSHHATFKGEISGNPKPDGSVTVYCQEDKTLVLNMGNCPWEAGTAFKRSCRNLVSYLSHGMNRRRK